VPKRVKYPHEQIENVGGSLRGHAETLRSTAASGGAGLPGGSLGTLAEGTATTISGHLTNVPGQIQQMANREEEHGQRLTQNSTAMYQADQQSRERFEAIDPKPAEKVPTGGGGGTAGGGGAAGGGTGGGGRGPTAPGGGSGRDPAWDSTPLFPLPLTNGRRIADLSQYPGGVQRDDNGLITHVGGRPIEEVTDQIGLDRAQKFREAAAGNKTLSQAKIREMQENGTFVSQSTVGAVTGVVVDRRTGLVYEGVNGRDSDQVPEQYSTGDPGSRVYQQDPNRLHPTLQANIDQMKDAGPYPALDRRGNLEGPPGSTRPFPHFDSPYGHAEMKAGNAALWDRRQLGLDDGPAAQGEMYAQTYMPFAKMSQPAVPGDGTPYCANCNHTMGGTPCFSGRFTGFPPSPDNLVGKYESGGGEEE
jgi:hypothetical protein